MKIDKQKSQAEARSHHHRKGRPAALTASLLIPAMAMTSLPTFAQDTAGQQQPRATALEEVIVTARRRQESLQDVPIAITALSDEFMRTNSIGSLNQIRHYAPSLAISNAGNGANTPVISLRGQRTSEAAIHLESAVPVYFSDVVMTPSAGTNMVMYDLQNVQVLKGPQGTLFGRNSTGGALLFTPKRPGEEFGGYAQLTAGNYDRIGTEFAADLPVSDKLMFRLAGKTEDRDGYQKNILNGDDLWDEKSRALRLSVLARPSENLENLLIVAWEKNDTSGMQPRLEAYARNLASQFSDDLERSLARDPMKIESDQPGQYEDVENWFVANTTEYHLNDNLTLKNIFGYRKTQLASIYDSDGSAEAFANMASDGLPAITNAEMFSNEFQVLGTALNDRLDWIAGAYYWQQSGRRISRSRVALGGGFDNIQQGDAENSAWALFTQGSYKLTERWATTLGARWSYDKREIDLRNRRVFSGGTQCTVVGDNGLSLPADSCSKKLNDNWNSPTWLASISYQAAPSILTYGSVSKGYRAGGFSIRATSLAMQEPFDEETVVSYELGLKSDWDYKDWSFRTNLAVYHQDFDDIQRTVSVPGDGSAFITLTTNAAKAIIRGGEIDFQAISNFGLDFHLNYAYVDTEYKDYFYGEDRVDVSGKSIEWIPKHQASATLKYTLPTSPSTGDISVQANYFYQSSQIATQYVGNDPIEDRARTVGSYNLVNYSLDWRSIMSSNFDASIYIKNARDERYAVGGLTVVESLGVALKNYGEPRTYGMSLRYNF